MSDEIAAQFLLKLRELLASSDIPDAELATRLGVSRPYLSRLRRSKRGEPASVTLGFALRAAAVFPELTVFFSPPDLPSSTIVEPESTETGTDA
jgi:transcriptional regulator with XRE-family HTH domain